MKSAVYCCLLLFLASEVTAFYNVARGKSFTAYKYNEQGARQIYTWRINDGKKDTCHTFKGRNFRFTTDLGKTCNIRSSVITFKGNISGMATFRYSDDSNTWPFSVYETYVSNITQKVEFHLQRTGRRVDLSFWTTNDFEFELCEIEIYGCESDYFGCDCQPCIKDDNCKVCDVNNGECYVCNTGYKGPNCSTSTGTDDKVQMTDTHLYYNDGNFDVHLPSYLLVDGDTTQPSCIDLRSCLNRACAMRLEVMNTPNVKDVQLYFDYKDAADIRVDFTMISNSNRYQSRVPFYQTGVEKISPNISEVKMSFPYPVNSINITFKLSVDELEEMGNTSVLLCELKVNGCPRNHYGSPCTPCYVNCAECHSFDGSCFSCYAGYMGWNCRQACFTGTYGPNCAMICSDHCLTPHVCDHVIGTCHGGCTAGWMNNECNQPCYNGWYGQNCGMRCSRHCMTSYQCDHVTGTCHGGCAAGWTNDTCNSVCISGSYGPNCERTCSSHCVTPHLCDHVTGYCTGGCAAGWKSHACDSACSSGWYGEKCAMRCSSHCLTPHLCDHVNGTCLEGCAIGWINDTCDSLDTEYCVDWVPPDVSVNYHNITWREEDVGFVVRYDPAVTLVCNFSVKSDEDLLYDVTWFIDGLEVFNQTVDSSSNYTAVITAHDFLTARKKMGSNVHCKVGAKRREENVACLIKVADPFFAGIKITNTNVELERKGSSNVELEMTIPFASESLYINGVSQPVSDLNIEMTFKTDDSSKCGGGGSSNQCEVKVKGYSYSDRHKYQNDEWRQNISFPVYSQDTDAYVINSHMTLALKTGGTNGVGSEIFQHVPLPDISIRVRETNNVWKGRSCGVRTDPHMYTFDGKRYECQIPGQFINYRNQRQLQWIQSKHHPCFPSRTGPWCVCAVAARAGRDVFVIDLCGGNDVINFEFCEDNVLKVTKVNDKHYKVYFPSGTTLSIYILDWRGYYNIDLEILPSAPDVGNAEGLCGYFDGEVNNDFRRRNSTFSDSIRLRYPNDFSRSWRIQDSENLFTGDSSVFRSLKSVSTILVPHCTCTDDGKTECSYSTFTPCSSNRGKQYTCNSQLLKNRRRKRDVSGADPSETRDITFVKTTEYAESVCLQAFQESVEYKLCQQHVTDLSNVTISNCIEDIKMTGDDNLTQIHVEAVLQQCSAFVLLNATLQEAEPEVTHTIENLCPNNCSSLGICEGGNCTCYSGYGGSDCSFDLLRPPTITDVPRLCDLSTASCSEATIIGKYFFENMNSNCYLSVNQVDVNQATVQEEQMQLHLEERTLFEGYCPLHINTSGTWTTEIKFNISNDGVRFTDTYNVFIYQSKCQEYHSESGKVFFTLKNDFCFIDSACVSPMESRPKNECLICNAKADRYQWTVDEYCGYTTFEQSTIATKEKDLQSSDVPFIVAASVSFTGLVAVLLLVVAVVRSCRKSNKESRLRQEQVWEARRWWWGVRW
ncbi:uncharacterized protein LOC125662024 [Ostrea edulis]|uniref:uncharacterized protein LOC125662024 n=1 Tax=Ostrea edulis TaxID=37623 RepID=UPI0024AFCFF5|nr:uncharacterized protein LOC125662024 [Ostrea edulis]